MPYNFTHALVGLTAQKQSSEPVNALISNCRREFLIGTMGPDPYFGDAMPAPLFSRARVDLANRLHAMDARAIFAAMLPLTGGSAVKRAYTLGFFCHFLLDTNAHPYIEARFPGKAHTPSEIAMDLMMTGRCAEPGVPLPPRKFYRTRHLRELDELHAALIYSLFGEQTRGIFARSYRKWIMINTISYDPRNRKRRFFGKLEDLLSIKGKLTGFLVSRHPDPDDRLNLSHSLWRAPWEKTERTESFVDLFENACAEAPGLMAALLDAMSGGEAGAALEKIGARRMDAKPV